MWLCAGGSILAGRLALERGLASHICGGFHHAYSDHGEGFCLINDVAIAIRAMISDGLIERAMVVDCDVHQGNGTAAIFAGDPAVFTFSIHQQHNYPPYKPPSDLDIGLENHTGDDEYLGLLDIHLPEIVRKHEPQLAFYLAGADPYRHDQLGGLDLSIQGLRERDEKVINVLREAGVAVATTTAGGYAISISDTVEIHCNTVRAARETHLGESSRG
jgi:acetoin utilization deacetylase AcuC-like enzyme